MIRRTSSVSRAAFFQKAMDEVVQQGFLDFSRIVQTATLLPGDHQSVHLGRGSEFYDVRPYRPMEDPLFAIDVVLSRRLNRLMSKVFLEETELHCACIVDASDQMIWGGSASQKFSLLLKSVALIGAAVLGRGNALSGICPNIPASFRRAFHDRATLLDFLWVLCEHAGMQSSQESWRAFPDAVRLIGKPSVVVVFSDFFVDIRLMERMFQSMAAHELVPVIVHSPYEHRIPKTGITSFADLSSGEECRLDPSSPRTQTLFAEAVEEYERELAAFFLRRGIVQNIHVGDPGNIFSDIFCGRGLTQ